MQSGLLSDYFLEISYFFADFCGLIVLIAWRFHLADFKNVVNGESKTTYWEKAALGPGFFTCLVGTMAGIGAYTTTCGSDEDQQIEDEEEDDPGKVSEKDDTEEAEQVF